jgi:hypothetical protein
MTVDELAARMDAQFTSVRKRFEDLDYKVDEGFKDSKIRDEQLRDLVTLGFEAREVLRDEMHRRFDDADEKHDQQVTLLQDAVSHLANKEQ